jgi:hypothetical protein
MLISFLFLLNAEAASAQSPANRTSPDKIIEYRLAENRKWQIRQLPQNSILYKYQTSFQGAIFSGQLKKQKFPSLQFALPGDTARVPQGTFQQPLLKQNREQNQPQKKYWWNENKVIRGNEFAPVKTNNHVLATSN